MHASHAPQLMSCNYYVCLCMCVCVFDMCQCSMHVHVCVVCVGGEREEIHMYSQSRGET